MENYFKTLNDINVNDKTEKKGNLTYLSWAWAWQEIKKHFPDATYTVYENNDGWNYFTDGRTAWVKTGMTVNGIEHIEYLPVMDFKNKSIRLEDVTSFDVNKAIQRSLTKAAARHGLGLYIYAGEDLPEEERATEGYGGDMNNVTHFEKGTLTPAQLKIIGAFNETQKKWVLKTYKVKSIDDLTTEQASAIIKQKEAKEAQKEAQKEAVAQ